MMDSYVPQYAQPFRATGTLPRASDTCGTCGRDILTRAKEVAAMLPSGVLSEEGTLCCDRTSDLLEGLEPYSIRVLLV